MKYLWHIWKICQFQPFLFPSPSGPILDRDTPSPVEHSLYKADTAVCRRISWVWSVWCWYWVHENLRPLKIHCFLRFVVSNDSNLKMSDVEIRNVHQWMIQMCTPWSISVTVQQRLGNGFRVNRAGRLQYPKQLPGLADWMQCTSVYTFSMTILTWKMMIKLDLMGFRWDFRGTMR